MSASVRPKEIILPLIGVGLAALVFALVLVGYLERKGPASMNFLNESTALIGTDAPEFELAIAGSSTSVSLADLKDRVVVLELTSTWCPPCQAQTEVIRALSEERSEVSFVTAIFRENENPNAPHDPVALAAHVTDWVKRVGLSYPVGLANDALVQAYLVTRVPTLFVIDATGVLRYTAVGQHRREHIEAAITAATPGTAGP